MTQKRVWPDFLFTHAPPDGGACAPSSPTLVLLRGLSDKGFSLGLIFNYPITRQPHCMRRFSPRVVISRDVPPLLRREIRRDLAFSSYHAITAVTRLPLSTVVLS